MLYFFLLLEGFIGLAYQILFLRQVEPHVGSSSVTTGWVIGIFLFALSLGYRKGGIVAKTPFLALGKNFIKTAMVASFGASAITLEIYFSTMIPIIGRLPALALFSTVVAAPVAFWMGQSVPLLLQRSKWGGNVSGLSGNALFLSTIGSTIGAILTPNILFHYFGATNTLLIIGLTSLLAGIYLFATTMYKNKIKIFEKLLFATLTILAITFLASNHFLKPSVPHLSSTYADMYVEIKEGTRYLWSNQLLMSINDMQNNNQAIYIDETAKLMDLHGIENKKVLVLGAGGFMLHRADRRKNEYLYVDIDPKLPEFVAENFNEDAKTMPFVAQDARAFLIEDNTKHDVIYLDTYSSRHALPRHLLTIEFFNLISSRLNDNGLLLVNAIFDASFEDPYSRNFHSTLMAAFPYCLAVVGHPGGYASNIIYHCQHRKEPKMIYTDDKNTAERDSTIKLDR